MIDVLNVPESVAEAHKAQSAKHEVKPTETFRYIATETTLRSREADDFYGSTLFYVLLVAPFAFIPVIVLARKKKSV
jgi:hypothetical protein